MIPWNTLSSFEFLTLIFLLAASFSISTIPIITVILLLLSAKNPIKKAIGFLIGRFSGIIVLSAFIYYLLINYTSSIDRSSGIIPLSLLELILGAVFMGLALRLWDKRKYENDDMHIPKIFRSIDDLSLPKACIVGFLALILSVKNWFLIVITVNALIKINVQIKVEIVIFVLFLIISSITIIIPVIIKYLYGDRMQPTLVKLKFLLIKNTNSIISVFMFTAGGLLFLTAIFDK